MASSPRLAEIQIEPHYWNHWHRKEQSETCAFEDECRRLHLDPENPLHLMSSNALRLWVRYWYKRRYVPEYLIVAFVPSYSGEFSFVGDEWR